MCDWLLSNCVFLLCRHEHGGGAGVRACHAGGHQQEDRLLPPRHHYQRDPSGILRPLQCPIHSTLHRAARLPARTQGPAPQEVGPRNAHPPRPLTPPELLLPAAQSVLLAQLIPERVTEDTLPRADYKTSGNAICF